MIRFYIIKIFTNIIIEISFRSYITYDIIFVTRNSNHYIYKYNILYGIHHAIQVEPQPIIIWNVLRVIHFRCYIKIPLEIIVNFKTEVFGYVVSIIYNIYIYVIYSYITVYLLRVRFVINIILKLRLLLNKMNKTLEDVYNIVKCVSAGITC